MLEPLSFYSPVSDLAKILLRSAGVGIDSHTVNLKIAKWLNKHGILERTKEFRSVYAFTLIEYGKACEPKELVNLFAHKEVIDAFNKDLYGREDGPDLDTVADDILHRCQGKSFLTLKKEFKASRLREEIKQFTALFSQNTRDSMDPKDLAADSILHEILKLVKELQNPAGNIPKELTLRIPRTSPDNIVGRERELAELHDRLNENRQVVLVNGLGGIGKTTLAQAYVSKYCDEYAHMAWIEKTSEDPMADMVSAKGLPEALGLEKMDGEIESRFTHIAMALKRIQNQPNLLIIDNADANLAAIKDSLPGQPQWHILVTSRHQIERFDLMELDCLPEPEAVELFFTHYSRGQMDEDAVKELVNAVGLHTLTVEILAKTANLHRIGPDKLKTAIEDDLKANVYVPHSGEKIEKVLSYLCSVFEMTGLEDDEIWLLKQFACMPPEFHTYDLLEELIDPEESQREDSFSEILENLVAKGWLTWNQATDSYKMHQIVADVVQKLEPVEIEIIKPLIDNLAEKLSLDQAKDNPIDKFGWIPYALAASKNFSEYSEDSIAILQNTLALRLTELGSYEEAKTLLQKVIISNIKNFGAEHPNTARGYSGLGIVLQSLGDYNGAKKLLEMALTIDEKHFGTEHHNTAVDYSNLALVLQILGDYHSAINLQEKALFAQEKNYGTEHTNTAICYSNLGSVLSCVGEFEKSKKLLQKALFVNKKNHGEEHPYTTRCYSNLGSLLCDLGEYKSAKICLEKALLANEKLLGPEHPETVTCYLSLASISKAIGEYESAKNLLRRVLLFNEKKFGSEHPNTARCYSNLGSLLCDLGDYEGAITLLEKALLANEKLMGLEHPDTAKCYSNLGIVFQEIGDYKGAKSLHERALLSFEKHFGTEHPNTARCYSNLALSLDKLKNHEGAIILFQKAIKSEERNFGTEHPFIARVYSNMALSIMEIGDLQSAKKFLQKAIKLCELNLGTEHPDTALSYSNLSVVLQHMGDYEGAITFQQRAIKSEEKNLGTEHPNTAISYSNLALIFEKIGDYKRAVELTKKTLEIFRKVFQEGHPYIKQATEIHEHMEKMAAKSLTD